MKWDGHTHTEFCPHGTHEEAERFVRRAIELGFDTYSITEHMPITPAFKKTTAGDEEAVDTAAMAMSDLPYYFKMVERLKETYKSDITIKLGFEVDYLADFEDYTRDFLNEYGARLDDGILSVHFMEGTDGTRSIDFSAEDYDAGLVRYHGSFSDAQIAYYQELMKSLKADLGPYKPKRIGHITLCRKFKDYFEEDLTLPLEVYLPFLEQVAKGGYQLDLNTAGLFKPYCKETYPTTEIIQQAKKLEIPLIYGSDSHGLADVGRGYAIYTKA
ncbi:histidinol-phosphatase HisJ [Listeria ilorinensis]|uniref:histidinol-phosphatase HisJ n=1 Tax=Listeria ilorinensis TaxID=2867439 RepID=UPI001EF55D91|nr:histidinol-phosphatase HisJ [Listeria ilorinensis]